MGNVKTPVLHVIDETIFFINTAAVFSLQVSGERFRFPDPFHTAVPFNVLDELVDPF